MLLKMLPPYQEALLRAEEEGCCSISMPARRRPPLPEPTPPGASDRPRALRRRHFYSAATGLCGSLVMSSSERACGTA